MLSSLSMTLTLLLGAGSLLYVVADDFTFCKGDDCGDCPVSITSIGTGYPDCAIYNSHDVFGNQGFEEADRYCKIQSSALSELTLLTVSSRRFWTSLNKILLHLATCSSNRQLTLPNQAGMYPHTSSLQFLNLFSWMFTIWIWSGKYHTGWQEAGKNSVLTSPSAEHSKSTFRTPLAEV